MTDDHAQIWDERYSESDQIWSGAPNAALVRETEGLTPGTALDVGCGEGADAIWLAGRGWRVTAADISRVALERAAATAREQGVADRVDWQHHDFAASFPAGTYDLVSAQFLHFHGDFPREDILRTAAKAVAPGGILLITGHCDFPASEEHDHADVHFPTPEEIIDALALRDGRWEILRAEEHERVQTRPGGRPEPRTDNTVKARRLPH
ncbi:SAM-dependent methyltransferase [Actinomadura roseirufa]|uniref:SAM-dependent methyltransferase n=1 Tax=Actinomadura roseirufa TaxID=2094049 RepID=UPI0010411F9B|nr:class I SAM-dependent methyltransferase [Actinomadura roseirufa]